MKKYLRTAFASLLLLSQTSVAQSFEWAFTMALQPRSEAVAVRQDPSHNVYIASTSDSASAHVSSRLEKRNGMQQVSWQKTIYGDVVISDLEINSQNHPVIIGHFTGTIHLDTTNLTAVGFSKTGFICECDTGGTVLWARTLNPIADDFEPVDLFIGANDEMYFTSELTGAGTNGACAFHKMDAWGNIVKSELNNNFEDRTFSHILADDSGNVYLSGTCGNLATFDALTPTISASYQNFLIKYDSSFTAQWILCKAYITFDHNNSLVTDGQNLYWVFDDFDTNNDTTRILKCDFNGQVLSVVNSPLGSAFFPLTGYSMDHSGNSTLVINIYARLFIYRYDNAFNILWNDTIYTQNSGFPGYISLACYDSCFYLANKYLNDSMTVGNFLLVNPNTGANYPSDVFVTKWSLQPATSVRSVPQEAKDFLLYPNPAFHSITMEANEPIQKIELTDSFGRLLLEKTIPAHHKSTQINLTDFSSGVYFIRASKNDRMVVKRFVKE